MIADRYLQLRSELEAALVDLLKLESNLNRDSVTLDTIQGLLIDVREPLLFVVVGEVKAGKSSLLNALFGQEFSKVDVLPATDRIYIFKYGKEERSVEVSPRLTERYLPIDFLRDFNVVDTPGTNTMVVEHQAITENFVPRADLILFVFSVTNPWTHSAWELLHFVQKKWLKNVIFILQQSDLREESEIALIRRHLQDTALQKLGVVPPIFSVSARKAFLARTTGLDKERLWNESGFGPFEEQINLMVSSASARIIKLQSICRSARIMFDAIAAQIRGSFEIIQHDEAQLAHLHTVLETRKEQTLRQMNGFLGGVELACRESANQGMRLLEQKLSFWRTWKLIFSKGQWQQDFQIEVESRLRDSVQPKVENAVQLLEADLRGLWPQLQDTIEAKFATEEKHRVIKSVPDFARERRELLQSIQLTLAENAAVNRPDEKLGQMLSETATWLRFPAGIAAAGGIVALISAMTSAAVADVTGILAASAAVVGSLVVFGRRKKILDAYRNQLEEKRRDLMRTIEEKLRQSIDAFYQQILISFQPLETFCITQRKSYEPLMSWVERLEKTLADLASRMT